MEKEKDKPSRSELVLLVADLPCKRSPHHRPGSIYDIMVGIGVENYLGPCRCIPCRARNEVRSEREEMERRLDGCEPT